MSLKQEIEEFLKNEGALKVGFANKETLAGPPNADITYILPEAKSAISYALLFDRDKIRNYLAKSSPDAFDKHEANRFDLNYGSTMISAKLARFLKEKGFESRAVLPNNNYKKEIKGWKATMPPRLSHRYVAVASGVGSFGWSGNVGMKDIGTTIHLGTVVTTAELEPTKPIPAEDSFCIKCKLCTQVCSASMFSKDESVSFSLGGIEYTHSKRNGIVRCQYVCGGFTGWNPKNSWSTWSPGRNPIPETNEEIRETMLRVMEKYPTWPARGGTYKMGYRNVASPKLKIRLTCGFCQNLCFGSPKETAENYKILNNSGCVIQNPDGSISIFPSEEAEKYFQSLPEEHKNKYCLDCED